LVAKAAISTAASRSPEVFTFEFRMTCIPGLPNLASGVAVAFQRAPPA
jgi:hypothetical protein